MIVVLCVAALTEPLFHGQLAKDYLQRTVNPTLIKGLTQLCKQKPEDPLVTHVHLVAIPDDRPRRIKAVITQHQRGLTTKNKNHKIA